MTAAETLEARARAELEMFFRMTVAEGAEYLGWREATERPWRITKNFSESYTKLESKARAATGSRGE